MLKIRSMQRKNGQTAIEYMLLMAIVVIVVLVGLKVYLPDTYVAANQYYNRVAVGILGEANPCGDGVCTPPETKVSCPIDPCP